VDDPSAYAAALTRAYLVGLAGAALEYLRVNEG
jgi:hypothetical protein